MITDTQIPRSDVTPNKGMSREATCTMAFFLPAYSYVIVILTLLALGYLSGHGRTRELSVTLYVWNWLAWLGGICFARLISEKRYVGVMILGLAFQATEATVHRHASIAHTSLGISYLLYLLFVWGGLCYLRKLREDLKQYNPINNDEQSRVQGALQSAYAVVHAFAVAYVWPLMYLLVLNCYFEH